MGERLRGLLGSKTFCKLAIVLCAFLWGTSFLVMKEVAASFSPAWVLAIRFSPVGLALLLVFRRRVMANLDARTLVVSLGYGALTWAGYYFQTLGLVLTTPGKSAFLTGTYCVMVPFCARMMGARRPASHHVAGILLSFVGMGFVALDNGFPLNTGDVLTLAGALFYALAIAELARWGPEVDVMVVSAWEFLVVGVLSAVAALLVEGPFDMALLTPSALASFAFLAIMCTAFALTLFNYAITVVEPAQSSLLSALESPFGVATSVLLGAEALTLRLLAGFGFIAAGVLASELGDARGGEPSRHDAVPEQR